MGKIFVEPAREYDSLPFGSISSKWFSTLADWVKQENSESDVGCIQLPEPLGELVGWFDVGTSIEEISKPIDVTIAGVPG